MLIIKNMRVLKRVIVLLVCMKLCMKMVRHACKSMPLTVFIAKRATLKTLRKTSFGRVPKGEAVRITVKCSEFATMDVQLRRSFVQLLC